MTAPALPVKLGLHDPTPGAVQLRLSSYANWREIPVPPGHFGHTELVADWGMLGNGSAPDNPPSIPDGVGNCAIAGPCHQIMQATAEGGAMAPFNTPAALKNYSAITGWTAADPASDQGTNIDAMAKYWRQHGLVDAAGATHQIRVYLDLNPGDLRELWLAMWLSPLGVGMGFALPQSAQEQTRDRQIWDYVPGSPIVGGHYVPGLARASNGIGVGVTWDLLQPFTSRFYQHHNNQGIVALSHEGFVRGKTLNGFDDVTLLDDLKEITRV